jgi:methylenetetrahydrofolate dehydrogenase (NADP+) / methenyltetrahydrofolate cyclohydrolase
MNPKVIAGKALAKKHEEALKEKLKNLIDSRFRGNDKGESGNDNVRNPSIVSFCNQDDPPSVKYTFMKLQKATDLGIDFIAEEFSTNTPHEYLVRMVKQYNENPTIDGIMVQLPLPEDLNVFKDDLLDLINPEKDVDGLTSNSPFLPATVRGVLSILDDEIENWTSMKIGVVGSEGEVGGPLVKVLKEIGLSVVEVDKGKGNLENDLQEVEVIISATGQEGLIKPEMIKERVILIDVGLGDFDPACYEKAGRYTEVTGGVGPMTVISLMENAVESYQRKVLK